MGHNKPTTEDDGWAAQCSLPAFRHFHPIRHIIVFLVLSALCLAMYAHTLEFDFQFDDEPNITKAQMVQVDELTSENVIRAIKTHPAKNRILVTLSFVVQHWAAQYLPRWDGQESKPDLVPWQFRSFNYFVHVLAGFAVYFLFLHLLQLPLLHGRFEKHAWGLATLMALVWFCCPIQSQAVTYVVQRATSMAAMFYAWSIVCYLRSRATSEMSVQIPWMALSLIMALCSLFSKEYAFFLPVTLILIEYLLIGRNRIETLRRSVFCLCVYGAVSLIAASWYFGGGKDGYQPQKAVSGVKKGVLHEFINDVPGHKTKISPRQRLMTESRVVAMYESLLLFPAPWRLTLDYDFLETTQLMHPDEYAQLRQWYPIFLILGICALLWLLPANRRALALVVCIAALLAIDEVSAVQENGGGLLNLSNLWRNPWPIPAFLLHGLLLTFGFFYAYRRPLMAFGLLFFYMGHLMESTIVQLEIVYEHRLYLPSIGFCLAFLLLVYEAFFPADTERLDPPPFVWKRTAEDDKLATAASAED